jgi:glycosyltransferase involved in cell wall biosynthesis
VVPAYREERLIAKTLGSIPSWVDAIFPVDDASPDGTWRAIEEHCAADGCRIQPQRHRQNRGVGAAIVTGYRAALAAGADVIAVMAGDDQMDPADLENVVDPVLRGLADYVKGNRFAHPERRSMPLARRMGGALLSALTRVATGLRVDDTQCGYTALSARVARALPLDELWPRYGYPNDLLGMLAARGASVQQVPVRPVYADEGSGVRPWHVLSIMAVILRRRLRTSRMEHDHAPSDRIARSTSCSAKRSV